MTNKPFAPLKEEIQEIEVTLAEINDSILQYEQNQPKEEEYKNKKFILKIKLNTEEKKKKINKNINYLNKSIIDLEKEITKHEEVLEHYRLKLLEEKESTNLKIKEISKKDLDIKIKNFKSLEQKNKKIINSLKDEFSKYLDLNNPEIQAVTKDRRFKKIYEKTQEDKDTEIIEKLKNYYEYENLQFLITNEDFGVFLEKLYSNEKYKKFWKHKLEETFESCSSRDCENINYYSKKIFNTPESTLKYKLNNQSIFFCNSYKGFHLGVEKEKKNFLFENVDVSKLHQILKSKKHSAVNKNKINQSIKNLQKEVVDERERINNYKNYGIFITDDELRQNQINFNFIAFGKTMDNSERLKYFNKVEIMIQEDKTELKNNHRTLKREEDSIVQLFKETDEKEKNLKEIGIYETDNEIKKRNQYKQNKEIYFETKKILSQKKEELRKKELAYYTEKSKNIKVDKDVQEINNRRFNLYDKNSS